MRTCTSCGSETNEHYVQDDVERGQCKACDIDTRRDGRTLRRYGITPEQYQAMNDAQHGLCAVCGKAESVADRRLAVDHNHKTGHVRGLLCFRCNTAIGKLGDDPGLLRKAADYLERT